MAMSTKVNRVNMTPEQSRQEARERLERTFQSKRWMAVFYRIEDGLQMERITCDFPRTDFSEAVKMLGEDTRHEPIVEGQPKEPLPLAPFVGEIKEGPLKGEYEATPRSKEDIGLSEEDLLPHLNEALQPPTIQDSDENDPKESMCG